MKKRWFMTLVGGLMLTTPLVSTPKTKAQSSSNCQHVSGHIDGMVSGFSETGTFFDEDGNRLGTFEAVITDFAQEGNGALKLQLMHTYRFDAGGTFTTSDNIVLSPIDPPVYGVNNRANVTGGTGVYQDAFGVINDHGVFNFQSGVVSVD